MLKKLSLTIALSLSIYATEVYTVDELIVQALENSPDLKISSQEYKASQSRYNLSNSNYLPKVDLLVSAGQYSQNDLPTNPENMVNDTIIKGQLTLKQLIYDFGKTNENSDSFKYDTQSFLNVNEQSISDKQRDVKVAYYDVINAIALISVHIENVKLNKAQLYRSKKYFDAGIRTKIDISDAQVELIKSKLELKNSEYNLKLAYASLDKVIGFKEINNDYKVFAQKLKLENLYSTCKDYALTFEEAISYAYEHRYSIKAFNATIKSQQSKERLTLSEYYPEFYLNANYTKQSLNEFKNQLPKTQWQTSFNLNWNIYQGGSTTNKAQEKKILTDIAKSKLQNMKLNIKKDVSRAYINVYKTKDSVELSQNLLKVSQEKFNQAQQRYEYGLSDYIELQQARQGYIDSMSILVVNYYNYYKAIAILDNSIGK